MSEEPRFAQKWVCLVCGQYWDTENEAKLCSEGHIEYQYEPKWMLGDEEFPKFITVIKLENKKPVVSQIYEKIK